MLKHNRTGAQRALAEAASRRRRSTGLLKRALATVCCARRAGHGMSTRRLTATPNRRAVTPEQSIVSPGFGSSTFRNWEGSSAVVMTSGAIVSHPPATPTPGSAGLVTFGLVGGGSPVVGTVGELRTGPRTGSLPQLSIAVACDDDTAPSSGTVSEAKATSPRRGTPAALVAKLARRAAISGMATKSAKVRSPKSPSLGGLKGLAKLRKATTLVKLTNRMDNRVEHMDEVPLKLWFQLHRRAAPESKMLATGESTCACVHPFPDNEHTPEQLCARGKLHWAIFEARNRAVVTFWTLLLFMYMPVSTRVMSYFLCEEIGSTWHLAFDRENRCLSGVWFRFLPIAIAGVIVFVFGVPVAAVATIYRTRRHHVDEYLELITEPVVAATAGPMPSVPAPVASGCCCWRRARRPLTDREALRHWQWERARERVGATKSEAARGNIKFGKVMVRSIRGAWYVCAGGHR